MKLIGLTGPAGSGKSTVAEILRRVYGFHELSFAEPLRWFACLLTDYSMADLDARKEQPALELCGRSPREFMQRLGTEFGRDTIGDDLWIRYMEMRLAHSVRRNPPGVVVSDVRFANEAAWVRARGELWHLTRPGKPVQAHISELGVFATDRDEVLDNSCDLAALETRVARMLGQ